MSRPLEWAAVIAVVLLLLGGLFAARTLAPNNGTLRPSAVGTTSKTGEIAFASDQSGPYQIYVLGADGSNLHQLTFGPDDHTNPIWSPDGKMLAYFQTRPFVHGHGIFTGPPDSWPPFSIYVMNADGSGARNVTPTPSRNFRAVTWSPDSKQIAVECSGDGNDDDGNRQICVLNVDGSGMRRVAPAAISMFDPVWSPDDRWIAALGQQSSSQTAGVYLVAPDGSGSRLISSAADAPVDLAWSPDGSKLEFTQRWFANGAVHGKITITNLDGSGRHDLDVGDLIPNGVQWSLDGARLLVVASAPLSSRSEVDIINADGTGLREIVPEDAGLYAATWSPDSQAIAYVRYLGHFAVATPGVYYTTVEIDVLRLDGSAPTTVFRQSMDADHNGLDGTAPAWRPVATDQSITTATPSITVSAP